MNETFCKLFDVEGNQVLIMIRSPLDGKHDVEIVMFYKPIGLGVCEAAIGFKSIKRAQAKFRKFSDEDAKRWFSKVMLLIESMMSAGAVE